MESTPLSAADVAAVTRGNYGYNDGFGMNGGWFWIVILLLFGRGFYGNEGLQTDVDTRFLERDIFNTNQNVSATSCQTQRDVLGGFTNLQAQLLNCCCDNKVLGLETRYDLGSKIDRNNYDNAIQTQTLSSQMAECCCSLKSEMANNTQKILDTINNNTIQDLRDRLAASQRETDTANLALQNNAQTNTILTTLGRYVTNPYVPYNYGCGCNTCNY